MADGARIMRLSGEGLALVKHFEGFSATAYADVAGHMTIGYGHKLAAKEHITEVTQQQAEALLYEDVRWAEQAVRQCIAVPLSQGQFDSLVSFTFNLGAGALQRSTLRQKINRCEHEAVPVELRRWVWAGGRRHTGLLRRRVAEGLMYQGLGWQK